MGVIFYFSSQEGIASHQKSFSIAIFLENIIEYITQQDLIKERSRKIFEFWVRKLAHVSEYFILTMLFYRALKTEKSWEFKVGLKSFVFSFLYAISDEVHQIFVAGRGPSPVDVFIDSLGMWLYLISRWLRYKIKAE